VEKKPSYFRLVGELPLYVEMEPAPIPLGQEALEEREGLHKANQVFNWQTAVCGGIALIGIAMEAAGIDKGSDMISVGIGGMCPPQFLRLLNKQRIAEIRSS
jgi:hypothetical protein